MPFKFHVKSISERLPALDSSSNPLADLNSIGPGILTTEVINSCDFSLSLEKFEIQLVRDPFKLYDD